MSRDLSTNVTMEKDKEANRPVELLLVHLDETTLYLANHPEDIEFFDENDNPQTYTAFAFSRDTISTNVDTKVDETSVSIDNVSREMSSYIANTEFRGRSLEIWKVFLDALGNPANKVVVFDGIMDSPQITQNAMKVNVVSKLDTLDKQLPGREYQVSCNWQFGNPDTCGATVPTKSGIVDSISSDYLTINDAGITETNNYWKHGSITIGNETRDIIESGSGYVKVDYPFSSAAAGDSYSMKTGCDKSYDAGHGCAFWSNTQYYGGFLAIPEIKDPREFG